MGGIGEHKTVIFVVCFLGFFSVLIAGLPNIFYAHQNDFDSTIYTQISVPDKWDTSAIGQGEVLSQDYRNVTAETYYTTPFYLTKATTNDTTIRLFWSPLDIDNLYFEHRHIFLFFIPYYVNMNPHPITKTQILQDFDSLTNVTSITLRCKDGDFQCLLQISFLYPTYQNMTDALNAGHIEVWLGIRASDTQTEAHYDAWTLFGQLLSFQAPHIHPLLNAIIAIPIWVSIGVAVIWLLEKILPW